MAKRELRPGMRVHFVGIGGYGLNPIARVMRAYGYRVSGCDLDPSPLAQDLGIKGTVVVAGHNAEHLDIFQPDALVVSSAVPFGNPELAAARSRGIPVYKRADVLGALMKGRLGVAVAGTHGKTTTSGMLAYVLTRCEADPSFIVGGVLRDLGTNARAGKGPIFVIEADEYDRMFMGLRPLVAIITTLDLDHPDMFESIDDVCRLFAAFADLLPSDGMLIANADDPEAFNLAYRRQDAGLRSLTYGLKGGDWIVDDLRTNQVGGFDFNVYCRGEKMGRMGLQLPGLHNVQNSLAVMATAHYLAVPFDRAAAAAREFTGVERRFEIKGEAKGVLVIDDYAHHPTAIRETIAATRARYKDRPLWAVWQPHTYSRVKVLMDEFAAAFDGADHALVTDIFASREQDTLGVHSQDVVTRMRQHPDARYVGTCVDTVIFLADHVQPGDVVLVMSAGDGTEIGPALLRALEGEL
jgi:UDP-N-acetylmuramate--alanine ligase